MESTYNIFDKLSENAWKAREKACTYGDTKVGCAIYAQNQIFTGCNIEQKYRNKDLHAEVCAISNMVSKGILKFDFILVVAEKEQFTPCGTCMDWIFQFGGEKVVVGFQGKKNGSYFIKKANELMPFYPK